MATDKKDKVAHPKSSRLGNYLATKAMEKELDEEAKSSGKKRKKNQDSAINLMDNSYFLQESDDSKQEEVINSDTEVVEDSFESKTRIKKEATPKPKQSLLKKLSKIFVALSILATVYAGIFILTPLIIVVPASILYVIWFAIVAVVSICTIGLIWINEGWRDFSHGFLDFNNKIMNFANNTTEFMANTFIGVSATLGLCVLISIAISAFGMFSGRFRAEKYKASFITSILLAVVYIAFIILDVYFINSGKSVL